MNTEYSLSNNKSPIVIVGAGPVGTRIAQELRQRLSEQEIVIYGDERWMPYNRTQLSSVVAGKKEWAEIVTNHELTGVTSHLGCAVVHIDPEQKNITDSNQRVQAYSHLVLATGSKPHVPNIPGVHLHGVFVFRDLDDTLKLSACRALAHRTVVLGAGLLGIEAAHAMRESGSDVTLVEHAPRLLPRQLDDYASKILQAHIEKSGIQILLGSGPARILGDDVVTGIELLSGVVIECDTVIISTGVHPNIELARQAKLAVNRGIVVNDQMQTSRPDIFAVGECCEHRAQVYGLVAPGLEQAGVAAHVIAGGTADYLGSNAASRLKLDGQPAFSMGEVGLEQTPDRARVYVWQQGELYRKIVLRDGNIIGALAMGDWPCIPRVQEAILHNRPINLLQRLLFQNKGSLWLGSGADRVQDWPEQTAVCNCTGVTRGQMTRAIADGCKSVCELSQCTGAGTVCGSCKPLMGELLGSVTPPEPMAAADRFFGIAITAAILAALTLFLPGLPFNDSVVTSLRWDVLWRNDLIKQISGYTLMALSFALGAIAVRKRAIRDRLGDYSKWRLWHTLIGVTVMLGFIAHTGGHMGTKLNFLLSLSFVCAALTGAVFAILLAREHKMKAYFARRFKSGVLWFHILTLWPFPVLLGFHIAQRYLF